MILINFPRTSFFAGLAILTFSASAYAQGFEPNYNPFTGQPNAQSYVIYSDTPYSYNQNKYNHRYYHVTQEYKEPYSFCYHNGQPYSEGSVIKHKKCVRSGFPNTPMSWESID